MKRIKIVTTIVQTIDAEPEWWGLDPEATPEAVATEIQNFYTNESGEAFEQIIADDGADWSTTTEVLP